VSVGQFASCAARYASDSFFSSAGVSIGGSTEIDRTRNLVERFCNKIKQCRRVATRYDKLAANYLAFVKLASIRIWLRANESTP